MTTTDILNDLENTNAWQEKLALPEMKCM